MVTAARWAAAVLVAVALAACSGDDDTAPSSTTSTTGPNSTTSPTGDAPIVRWREVDRPIDLGEGWGLEPCEGDAPIVCITRDGERVGIVELVSFPIETLPEVQAALATSEAAALDAHAAAFLRDIRADRAVGCPPGYLFVPGASTHVTTADGAAITYRFAGQFADGRASEQTIQYAAIRDDALVIIQVAGYEPDSCPSSEGDELAAGEVDDFAPVLERVVVANPMPAP